MIKGRRDTFSSSEKCAKGAFLCTTLLSIEATFVREIGAFLHFLQKNRFVPSLMNVCANCKRVEVLVCPV